MYTTEQIIEMTKECNTVRLNKTIDQALKSKFIDEDDSFDLKTVVSYVFKKDFNQAAQYFNSLETLPRNMFADMVIK